MSTAIHVLKYCYLQQASATPKHPTADRSTAGILKGTVTDLCHLGPVLPNRAELRAVVPTLEDLLPRTFSTGPSRFGVLRCFPPFLLAP